MVSPHNDKLTVLIDADNALASIVGELLAEVSRSANNSGTYRRARHTLAGLPAGGRFEGSDEDH